LESANIIVASFSIPRLRSFLGVHMLGYVADTTQEAADTFFPGYAKAMTDVGKERGWPAMTRASFDAQRGRDGALYTSTDTIVANVRAKLLSVIIPPLLENCMSQLRVPVERAKMPTTHAVRVRHPLET
jgi:hypothetical protein